MIQDTNKVPYINTKNGIGMIDAIGVDWMSELSEVKVHMCVIRCEMWKKGSDEL